MTQQSTARWVIFGLLAFLFLAPDLFAGTTNMPWESTLQKIQNSLSGPVAGALALIGIVGAGGMLIFGGDNLSGFMRMIVYLVLVISIIIGGNTIIQQFTATGALI